MQESLSVGAVNQVSLALHEPEWICEKRREAYEKFLALPFPHFKYGMSVQMNMGDFQFEKLHTYEPITSPSITFRAPPGVLVLPLHAALLSHEALVKKHLFALFDHSQNQFTAFHAAFWRSGIFVCVPPGFDCTEPVHLFYKAGDTALQHTLLVVGEGSHVSVVEHLLSDKNDDKKDLRFSSMVTELFVGDRAHVTFSRLQDYSLTTFHFDNVVSRIGEEGSLVWNDVWLGSMFTHSENKTVLAGQRSSVLARSVFFGGSTQQFDLGVTAVHAAPHTQSVLRGRGVLQEQAKNIYRGLIHIQRSAPGSDGYQKQDTLLLDPRSEADNIPQLQIDNNDVKCGHAATVGQVDKEKLFYLMSRGLSREDAQRMIVKGYFDPFLRDLPAELYEEVRSVIDQRVQ